MIIFRKERLETELAALRNEWRQQMERSLKSVADESIARLTRESAVMEKEAGGAVQTPPASHGDRGGWIAWENEPGG